MRKPITTTYQGFPDVNEGFGMVFVDGKELTPHCSLKVRNHSPTGFAWGYSGSGPAQLSLAILLDYFDDEQFAQRVYQRFKESAVSFWHGEWKISGAEIDSIVEGIE